MRAGEISNILKPSVPYIEIAAAVNGAIGVGWNDLTWSFLNLMTSDFSYQDDGTILIYTTGMYKIEFELGLKLPNQSTNSIVQLRVLINGIETTSSRSIGKILNGAGETNNYLQLITSKVLYLKASDLISGQFNTTNNTILIADDIGNSYYYSRLRISYIPMGGWNNESGGNIIFRGIRR